MKCMVLEEFGKPLVPREREIPVPGEGDVIVKVRACGVCQTDLKVLSGVHPGARQLPLVPGHEVAGEIVEVGRGVDKSTIGKHAVVYNYHTCGACEYCKSGRESICIDLRGQVGMNKDGGFAEYLKAPAACVFFISKDIPFEQAAIMTDAVATPYHAIASKAKVKPGDTVAVFGVGGLGLHAVQIANVFGAKVIAVDIKEGNLALAKKMGAAWTLMANKDDLAGEILALTGGKGVDAVIELTGIPHMEILGLDILKVAGRLVVVAYNMTDPFMVRSFPVVSKELEIHGARWCGREEFKQCIDLVAGSKITPFVGEVHPLLEANTVLKRLKDGEILGRGVLVP